MIMPKGFSSGWNGKAGWFNPCYDPIGNNIPYCGCPCSINRAKARRLLSKARRRNNKKQAKEELRYM